MHTEEKSKRKSQILQISIKKTFLSLLLFSGIFEILFLLFNLPTFAYQESRQNVSVSATVPPKQSDFAFNLKATDGQTLVTQETTLSYQITYGATSENETFPTSITVDFANDAPNGLPLLRYVIGSASTAYGNIQPTVDVNNRTITWNLPDLPEGANHALNFKLQTTSNYIGETHVPITLNATMHNGYVNIHKKVSNQAYHTPSESVEEAVTQPTTTLAPTPLLLKTGQLPTKTPMPTQNPNPTPSPSGIQFDNLSFSSITQNAAALGITTNVPSTLVIKYGKSSDKLTQSITDSSVTTTHRITIDALTPDTPYYLQVIAQDEQNAPITSEVFTFRSARTSSQPQVNHQSLIFTSSNLILFSAAGESKGTPTIVLPQNVVYNFRFSLNEKTAIKKLVALIRNTTVLGITSDARGDPGINGLQIIDHGNGIFEAKLTSPLTTGTYEIYTRIWDTNGNLQETSLAYIRVTQPLTVIDQDNKPIEAAKVLFSVYNPRSKDYEIISPETFPIKNPSITDRLGQIHLPLPEGKYKIRVSAIGYKTKTVPFHIGPFTGQNYPIITLESQPFTIGAAVNYYWQSTTDAIMLTRIYVKDMASSSRFFELNTLVIVGSFVFLTLFALSSRLRIPLNSLSTYFLHLAQIHRVQQRLGDKIQGRIFDEEGATPLPQTHVYLIDSSSKSIVGHTTTNKDGAFTFKKIAGNPYTLQVMRENYEPITIPESAIQAVGLGGYLLSLHKHPKGPNVKEKAAVFVEKLLGMLFESLLLLSLGFELCLGYVLGWEKAAPFLILSVITLILWLIHLTHLRRQKDIF